MRISDWSSDVCSSDLHRIGRLLVDRIGERRHHAPFRCGWARLPDVGKAFLIAAKTKPPFSLETGGGGLRDPLDRAPALTLRDQHERVLERLAGAGVVTPVERHVGDRKSKRLTTSH